MAKGKQANVGPMTPKRPLQPNAKQYQQATIGGNPGEPPASWQNPRNAEAARDFEQRFNSAQGTGGSAVGSAESARSNPPGVGPIPSGATGKFPRQKGK